MQRCGAAYACFRPFTIKENKDIWEKNDVVEIHDGMLDNACYAKNDVSIDWTVN